MPSNMPRKTHALTATLIGATVKELSAPEGTPSSPTVGIERNRSNRNSKNETPGTFQTEKRNATSIL